MIRPILVLLASSSLALPLPAQGAPRLPAEVETVVSGGFWEQGALEGRYRAVVRSGGFEHVVSHLSIDWIISPTEADTARVIASVSVPTTGVALHDLEFANVAGRWVLIVQATDSHFDPPRRASYRILLGAPGSATLAP